MDIEDRLRSREINIEIILAEVYEYERKCWERARFCNCGADIFQECSCPEEKKKEYIKQLNRKIEEKFGDRMKKINRGLFDDF